MGIFNKIKLWINAKQFFYRYNLSPKFKNGEWKTLQDTMKELENIYFRLPQEERIVMRIKIQNIIDLYNKERK